MFGIYFAILSIFGFATAPSHKTPDGDPPIIQEKPSGPYEVADPDAAF